MSSEMQMHAYHTPTLCQILADHSSNLHSIKTSNFLDVSNINEIAKALCFVVNLFHLLLTTYIE